MCLLVLVNNYKVNSLRCNIVVASTDSVEATMDTDASPSLLLSVQFPSSPLHHYRQMPAPQPVPVVIVVASTDSVGLAMDTDASPSWRC